MAQEVLLKCGHKITLDGALKMREIREWGEAERRGAFQTCYGYLARLVKSWDWEDLDPSDPASYDELLSHEYQQVYLAVTKYVLSPEDTKN